MPPTSALASTPRRSLRRLAGLLLALAVVPALVFAAFQVFAQAESEALLARVREDQLGTLLFSVDQQAWEVADTWAGRLARTSVAPPAPDPAAPDLQAFLSSAPPVQDVVVIDTALRTFASLPNRSYRTAAEVQARQRGGPMPPRTTMLQVLQADVTPARVARLLDQYRNGYRRLDPVPLPGDRLALVFVADGLTPGAPHRLLALVVHPRRFVEQVVVPRLREVGRAGLDFAVFTPGADSSRVGPVRLARADVARTRPLWILPGYTLGVRPSADSAEAVLRRRLVQSLLLIGSVTLLLVLGGVLAFRAARREVALAQLREDFVSNVSHELRTPLALIRLYAETLAEGRVPGEARRHQYYTTIVAEAERLSRLVGNVLHFSRRAPGPAALTLAPLDLGALVADVAARYRPVLERAGVTLAVDVAPGLPPVAGNADALAEALVNLLDNAAKYGAAGGEVTAAARADAGQVVVEVLDRGPGVPEAMRTQVFEPFVRVQAASADGLAHTAKGTGLGLALVRQVATAHGGTATVQPRAGGGAAFVLTLPVAP